MTPSDVILFYVRDVARHLPMRQRFDVAAELRTLLAESLHERTGGEPEEKDALALVREFGLPAQVAARYATPLTLIPPDKTGIFIFWGIVGAALFGALHRFSVALNQAGVAAIVDYDIGPLEWVGLWTLGFACWSLVLRRDPAEKAEYYKPSQEDTSARWSSLFLFLALSAAFMALYVAPGALVERLSQGQVQAADLAYSTSFGHWTRFTWLPVVLGILAAIRAAATIRGSWSSRLGWAAILVEILAILQVGWHLRYGEIFANPTIDVYAAPVATLFALIWSIEVAGLIHQEIGRVDPPAPPVEGARRIAGGANRIALRMKSWMDAQSQG